MTVVYDFAVERVGRSASSAITGTVAAIAADLVARGGPPGVHPPEAAFDPGAFRAALAERDLLVSERELARLTAGPLTPTAGPRRRPAGP